MKSAALIGLDWGSSAVRAMRIGADGGVIEMRRADDGVLSVGGGRFEERLRDRVGDWLAAEPATPILMCGMIGSDRGWAPAPYAPAPAGAPDIASRLARPDRALNAWIAPGVSYASGDDNEVMRGEETQIVGFLATFGAGRARLCLPGTHSKWVEIEEGRIAAFRTYMTGEVRALALRHGALATDAAQVPSRAAFAAGLRAASGAAITRALFQARTRRLAGVLDGAHVAAFASGVLVGAEMAGELARPSSAAPLFLAARGALGEDYVAAFDAVGLAYTLVDPEPLVARGLAIIARCAGLIGPPHD